MIGIFLARFRFLATIKYRIIRKLRACIRIIQISQIKFAKRPALSARIKPVLKF